MKTVGIKELKTKLSAYINEVRTTGKTVLVTDHGEEVALVIPLSDEYRLIRLLEISAKAHWSKGKPLGIKNGIVVRGEPLSVTILEERE
jgi:prevent-host-death family protein